MQIILLVIAASVATMGPWRATAAPIYRWCANYEGRDVVTCAYDTFQQCLDTAGGGAGGFLQREPGVASDAGRAGQEEDKAQQTVNCVASEAKQSQTTGRFVRDCRRASHASQWR